MMNRGYRSAHSYCANCSVRILGEAWICSTCAFDNDYYSARFRDEQRAPNASAVSRSMQRHAGNAVAYEQFIDIQSGDETARRKRGRNDLRFTREELADIKRLGSGSVHPWKLL